jgi:hypothetical protein
MRDFLLPAFARGQLRVVGMLEVKEAWVIGVGLSGRWHTLGARFESIAVSTSHKVL